MDRRWIDIDEIAVIDRARTPNMAKVKSISENIKEHGLLYPPAVRFVDGISPAGVVDEDYVNTPMLIIGLHRLLALKMIGRSSVECDVYDVSASDAKLMEIDENLERSELDAAERTKHVKLREITWKLKQAELAKADGELSNGKTIPTTQSLSKRGRAGEGRPKQFAAETAKVAGVTKRAINQELRRAEKLADVIDRLPGTSLNSGVEMDALIKLPVEERVALIDRAEAGEKVSARTPTKKNRRERNPADPNNCPSMPTSTEPDSLVFKTRSVVDSLFDAKEYAIKEVCDLLDVMPDDWRNEVIRRYI